ncbi:MAG: RluA family pseudouridine synthase [Saprospiraceae bacterium]
MQILFEDYYLLVVNKPAGLSTESGGGTHPSAEKEALFYFTAQLNEKSTSKQLKPTPYLRAVHRLDRPASGVLVLAKTKAALTDLMTQFENRETQKTYLAITPNLPPADSGTLTHWLKKDEAGRKALVFDRDGKGLQKAELRYTVREKNWKGALLELHPLTGRFHQIRAQLGHIGCPIFGDELYGSRPWKEYQIKLHAWKLKFRHPKSGEIMEIEAPVPENW